VDELLEITLTDNGIGFEQEHAARIFDTFARLHARDKYEGTGLGLALCKKIVERHHGAIRASGEKNKGAVFTLQLPLVQQGKNI
jgi:signal transduction histidine kinase